MYATCKAFTAFILMIAVTTNSNAQYKSSVYEAGISVGTLIYQGDLTPKVYGYTKSLRPALQVYGSKALSSYFSLRAGLTYGKILADESKYTSPDWRQFRNFKFSSRLIELSAVMIFNPYGVNNEFNYRRLAPYVLAGAGLTYLHVKRDWSGFNTNYFDGKSPAAISLAADSLHKTPTIIPVLPVGAGGRYILSPALALHAEFVWRLTPSDYIDGFSYRDTAPKRDSYYSLSAGITYRFGKDPYRCPRVN